MYHASTESTPRRLPVGGWAMERDPDGDLYRLYVPGAPASTPRILGFLLDIHIDAVHWAPGLVEVGDGWFGDFYFKAAPRWAWVDSLFDLLTRCR